MARHAGDHGRACRPGQIAQDDKVDVSSNCVSDHGSNAKENYVDDELERILAMSPVGEGRNTATEH
jgi:hypothetical protein